MIAFFVILVVIAAATFGGGRENRQYKVTVTRRWGRRYTTWTRIK